MPMSEQIEIETEVNFAQYLKKSQTIQARWWNPFSWGLDGLTKDEAMRGHLEAWEDETFLEEYNRNCRLATAEDVLSFVSDFQNKQEVSYLSNNDVETLQQ